MKKYSAFLAKITFLSFFFLTIAPAVLPAFVSDASAAGSTIFSSSVNANTNVLVDSMCNAMKIVTGNAGKTLAGLAVVTMGIGFFTGKISWGLMIGLAMGIAAMFGASTIVAAISGKDSYDCGN